MAFRGDTEWDKKSMKQNRIERRKVRESRNARYRGIRT